CMKPSCSLLWSTSAAPISRSCAAHVSWRMRDRASPIAGRTIEMSSAMMPITTSSSISVKPRRIGTLPSGMCAGSDHHPADRLVRRHVVDPHGGEHPLPVAVTPPETQHELGLELRALDRRDRERYRHVAQLRVRGKGMHVAGTGG